MYEVSYPQFEMYGGLGTMTFKDKKPKFDVWKWSYVFTKPLLPALAGYGMFWWYQQPFGIDFPVGFSLMVACYIAALGGVYVTTK